MILFRIMKVKLYFQGNKAYQSNLKLEPKLLTRALTFSAFRRKIVTVLSKFISQVGEVKNEIPLPTFIIQVNFDY